MPANHYDHVQIHNFIAHFLDLFEARDGDRIHRYYDDRSAHNMIQPDPLSEHRRPAVLSIDSAIYAASFNAGRHVGGDRLWGLCP